MKMNVFPVACSLLLLLAGCASVKTVNDTELTQRIIDRLGETVNGVAYMGTKDGFHYLKHNYTLGSDTYRISEKEFLIKSPFPLTENRSQWRSLVNSLGYLCAESPSPQSKLLDGAIVFSDETGNLMMLDTTGAIIPLPLSSPSGDVPSMNNSLSDSALPKIDSPAIINRGINKPDNQSGE